MRSLEQSTHYVKVDIADMKVIRQKGSLITYALGSCIGVSFYDPILKVGALLHIMLPESVKDNGVNPFMYADLGIQETLRFLQSLGVAKQRIQCKIAGGSSMLANKNMGNNISIGERNYLKVKGLLKQLNLQMIGEDVGGTRPRTMVLNVENGVVNIQSTGRSDIVL